MNRYCRKQAATHPNCLKSDKVSHAFDQAAHAPVHHSLRRRIPALPLSCLRHPCPLRYWNIQEPIFIVRKALTELLCPQWSKIVTYSLGSPRVFAHGARTAGTPDRIRASKAFCGTAGSGHSRLAYLQWNFSPRANISMIACIRFSLVSGFFAVWSR